MQKRNYKSNVIVQDNAKIYDFIKRLMDIIFSLAGLLILSPIFLIIVLFYLFGENRGPVFFKQVRVGRKGEYFLIYKFRSMVVNAEEKLKSDQNLYKKYLMNNYKLEPHEDPRITKFGRALRSTSLDEIPQLINVLKGEMSLVGPRPVVKEEINEYGVYSDKFVSVKPGITGYWAVSGRSNVDYPERVDLELYYVDHQSLRLDIKILVHTLIQVLKRKGAY